MKKYVFYDVDQKEIEVEESLCYIRDRLNALFILYSYAMSHGFSDSIRSVMGEYLESLSDISFELVSSVHIVVAAKCDRDTHA